MSRATITRRHHNNKGRRQIAKGKTRRQVELIAVKIGLRYAR